MLKYVFFRNREQGPCYELPMQACSTIAPGQIRLIRVGTCIVREIDIIVISVGGSKPLSSKT